MKIIEFYPNGCKSRHEDTFVKTQEAIEEGKDYIRTSSMLHFSMSLLEKGYNIILVGKDGAKYKIYNGLTTPNGKKVSPGNNIGMMLIKGVFNPWIL